jgi:hypothetical protein
MQLCWPLNRPLPGELQQPGELPAPYGIKHRHAGSVHNSDQGTSSDALDALRLYQAQELMQADALGLRRPQAQPHRVNFLSCFHVVLAGFTDGLLI